MADDKREILQKLQELLAMDNSDKEYLVDALLKDKEVKQQISSRLVTVVENMINHEDSNNVIKNVIGKIVENQMKEALQSYKDVFLEEIEQQYIKAKQDVSNDILAKADEYSSKVEGELKAVLATEVATALYDKMTSK